MLYNFTIQWNKCWSKRERMDHAHGTMVFFRLDILMLCYIQYILHTHHIHHCTMRHKSDHMTLENIKFYFKQQINATNLFFWKLPHHICITRGKKQLASQKWQAHKHTNRTKRNETNIRRENREKTRTSTRFISLCSFFF